MSLGIPLVTLLFCVHFLQCERPWNVELEKAFRSIQFPLWAWATGMLPQQMENFCVNYGRVSNAPGYLYCYGPGMINYVPPGADALGVKLVGYISCGFEVSTFNKKVYTLVKAVRENCVYQATIIEQDIRISNEFCDFFNHLIPRVEPPVIGIPAPSKVDITDKIPGPPKVDITDGIPAPPKVDITDGIPAPPKIDITDGIPAPPKVDIADGIPVHARQSTNDASASCSTQANPSTDDVGNTAQSDWFAAHTATSFPTFANSNNAVENSTQSGRSTDPGFSCSTQPYPNTVAQTVVRNPVPPRWSAAIRSSYSFSPSSNPYPAAGTSTQPEGRTNFNGSHSFSSSAYDSLPQFNTAYTAAEVPQQYAGYVPPRGYFPRALPPTPTPYIPSWARGAGPAPYALPTNTGRATPHISDLVRSRRQSFNSQSDTTDEYVPKFG